MTGPGFLTGKAYVAVNNVDAGGSNSGDARYGGRLDVRKEINEIHFTASITDLSLKDYNNAPYFKDALITAEKRLNANSKLGLGYDFGAQNAFASITGETNVSNKPIEARATWFQRSNAIRTEADVRLDARQKLWGTYTFNTAANAENSTFVNLRERQGFIIAPFTVPIATAAATYTYEKDGYVFEPQYDFHKQAPYLSVYKNKFWQKSSVKGHYAFKDETAMVEFGYAPNDNDLPVAKAYLKGHLGRRGVGPFSAGLIFDKTIDL
jgi:hypothetical protein